MTGSELSAAALKSDVLVAEARKHAMLGPDQGSGLAMVTLKVCEELIVYRDIALKLERMLHEIVKDAEI
jgi:hypothetical protein